MPPHVAELELPNNERSRLASAIMATLDFAGSITDFLVHEGQPLRVKSAAGVIPVSQLNVPASDFVVLPADIKNFVTTYVDGQAPSKSANDYFEEVVAPELAGMSEVHRSLTLLRDGKKMCLRVSLFRHSRDKLGMVCRLVTPPPELSEHVLPRPIIDRIEANPRGLLILTGPTGSGKTSCAYSLLDYLNRHSTGHLITIEDPIEYPLEPINGLVTQREVGRDVSSFGAGLMDAMRHAPEAILASEIRDRDAAEAGILGSESGALMIVTTHGRSILGTLRKILALCGDNSGAMRTVLAGGLIGVVRNELVPKVDKRGYALLQEALLASDAVTQAIAKADWRVLEQAGRAETTTADFFSMKPGLTNLVQARQVDREVAKQVQRASAYA